MSEDGLHLQEMLSSLKNVTSDLNLTTLTIVILYNKLGLALSSKYFLVIGKTNKIPTPNMLDTCSFLRNDICSLKIDGMGRMSTARSSAMLIPAQANADVLKEIHFPVVVLRQAVQKSDTGRHWKAMTNSTMIR